MSQNSMSIRRFSDNKPRAGFRETTAPAFSCERPQTRQKGENKTTEEDQTKHFGMKLEACLLGVLQCRESLQAPGHDVVEI